MRSVKGRITPTQNWLQIHNWKKSNDSFSKGGNNIFPQTNLVPCDRPTNNHHTACPVGFWFGFASNSSPSAKQISQAGSEIDINHTTRTGTSSAETKYIRNFCRPSHNINLIPILVSQTQHPKRRMVRYLASEIQTPEPKRTPNPKPFWKDETDQSQKTRLIPRNA